MSIPRLAWRWRRGVRRIRSGRSWCGLSSACLGAPLKYREVLQRFEPHAEDMFLGLRSRFDLAS